MGEPKKNKKASDEQKEFILSYMEDNLEFAHERFEPSDGAHLKAAKWQMLAINLNAIGGAWKDVNQWRKYWRDQKLHAKEREALIKASFQRSGVNGTKKVKPLSPFEERVVALLAPAAISGADVPELFTLPQGQADTRTVATTSKPSQLGIPEAEVTMEASTTIEASEIVSEMPSNPISLELAVMAVAGPSSGAAPRPTPRKRKKAPSGKNPEISSFEEKILKIEEEKLFFIKKNYEMEQQSLTWKKEYEDKVLKLREREILVQEKELELKFNKIIS